MSAIDRQMRYLLSLMLLLAVPAMAQTDPGAEVSQQRLQADVETLVSFGTRHTISDPDDPVRGIGAARRWATSEFEATSRACGGCLEIIHPERVVTGDRIPDGVLIQNVVAIQRGSERPDEVVIVQAHIDSRASDVMDAASDAPGANDNASGSALVLEAARVLSQREYPATVVYALLSGEEQGLFGGELMAEYALEQGWSVKAVLNNDIVGGSCGSDGICDAEHVRVFSEGVRADVDEQALRQLGSLGGENDSPSRNISRWLDELAGEYEDGLEVRQTWRSDRMGRGGDHLPFLDRGLPAIRFSVAVEDYEHQHQDLRVEDGVTYGDTVDEMDFGYLAKVTRLNVQALDRLARLPMPPHAKTTAAVQTFTTVDWVPALGATSYRIYRRGTDEPYWPSTPEEELTLESGHVADEKGKFIVWRTRPEVKFDGVRGDDWIFGVAACNGEICSPISSAVPGGAFAPTSD
jgi:hypothetical protein